MGFLGAGKWKKIICIQSGQKKGSNGTPNIGQSGKGLLGCEFGGEIF